MKAGTKRILEILMVGCISVMSVLVFGNVVLRYAFNSGITLSEEISRLLFVWLTFLGAISAMHEKAHLGVDTLVKRLSPRGRRLCRIASDLLILLCCAIVVLGGWRQAVVNLDNLSPVAGISNAWLYAGAVVAGLGIASYVLSSIWRAITGRLSDSELIQVAESEEHVDGLSKDATGGQR